MKGYTGDQAKASHTRPAHRAVQTAGMALISANLYMGRTSLCQ